MPARSLQGLNRRRGGYCSFLWFYKGYHLSIFARRERERERERERLQSIHQQHPLPVCMCVCARVWFIRKKILLEFSNQHISCTTSIHCGAAVLIARTPAHSFSTGSSVYVGNGEDSLFCRLKSIAKQLNWLKQTACFQHTHTHTHTHTCRTHMHVCLYNFKIFWNYLSFRMQLLYIKYYS